VASPISLPIARRLDADGLSDGLERREELVEGLLAEWK